MPSLPFRPVGLTQVTTWERLWIPHNTPPTNFDSISNWWEAATKLIHKNHKQDFNGIIYIMQNL
jgi:hypothetical protein